ncbi:hypothetical protein MRX96_053200 [Rhipicephalus microplus]
MGSGKRIQNTRPRKRGTKEKVKILPITLSGILCECELCTMIRKTGKVYYERRRARPKLCCVLSLARPKHASQRVVSRPTVRHPFGCEGEESSEDAAAGRDPGVPKLSRVGSSSFRREPRCKLCHVIARTVCDVGWLQFGVTLLVCEW